MTVSLILQCRPTWNCSYRNNLNLSRIYFVAIPSHFGHIGYSKAHVNLYQFTEEGFDNMHRAKAVIRRPMPLSDQGFHCSPVDGPVPRLLKGRLLKGTEYTRQIFCHFYKGHIICYFIFVSCKPPISEKGSTLKGRNLLPMGANSFLLG